MPRSARRPLGQPTRGKTAANRLRKTDNFLAVAYPEVMRHMAGLYVDLGYGAYPVTSVETLQRLRKLNPAVQVLGVEIDPQRVVDAQPYARAGLQFRLGGFNLPLQPGEQVSVIRALNVLRQYDEAAVEAALLALSEPLTEDGLIIEGTSDPPGRRLTFNLFQKRSGRLERIALVLAPTLDADFQPRQLQPVLPKNFIHHAEPGGPVDRFFGAWHASWQAARAAGSDRRQVFAQAGRQLAERYGYAVDPRPALLRRGFLVLGAEWPYPRQRPAGTGE